MSFLNIKGRKIQVSDRGAYFVRKNGEKVYGVKAAFRVVAGKPVKITPLTVKNVPRPIRPVLNKTRSANRAAAVNFMKGMTTTSANIKKLRRLNNN